MSLSVIVTSYNSPDTLRECLASLTRQPAAAEIIVSDCSAEDPTDELRAVFPHVRVLHFTEKRSVPGLRWAAVWRAGGDLIATTEARLVPAGDWCAELVRAHALNARAPVIGGPVTLKTPASGFDWGLYLCEYGAFGPPVSEGEVRQLSSANLCYKRVALEESRDLLDAGLWETPLHERWIRHGRRLRLCGATVVFQNQMNAPDACKMRFHNGRSYAAERVSAWKRPRQLLYAAGCLVLPWLLTWRIARAAHRQSRMREFWRALPWILGFSAAWAGGELVGYLVGGSAEPHIY